MDSNEVINAVIEAQLPMVKNGNTEAAEVVLRCLEVRARLAGL